MNCERDGCSGVILDDGYCDRCWLTPVGAANSASSSATNSATGVAYQAPAVTTGSTSKGPRTHRRGTTATARHRLGLGLVDIPTVPAPDPASAVMANPQVAEQRRYCSQCHEPVGRSRGGVPGRTEGFCARCGTAFGFEPKVAAGELVAGQYEISGCLAHGGLGWVYLARDRMVSDRWVVLKGLLDSGDRDAMAAALAERRFLAEVEHDNIVKIHNFVEHRGADYIVMEFVNGVSLRDTLRQRREANGGLADPLPIEQAIAYILEILPAIGHLHDRRLLYCDFKPDNVIRTERSVKLIDLGGVYRLDDETSPVYGTIGYQAPEIAETGPTVASDIFTVGRTLAVLCTDFAGYQSTHRFALSSPDEVQLYREFDSLYRVLDRATAIDPDERFENAEEMSAQLLGVLREIVAARTATPIPGASTVFAAPGRVATSGPVWRALPRLVVDPEDPGAGVIFSLGTLAPDEVLDSLDALDSRSVEIELWRVRMLIEVGQLDAADAQLALIESDDPWAWRVWWYRGVVALERGSGVDALRHFDAVYRTLPGELGPKVAMGFATELATNHQGAVKWYQIVARTDPAYTVAAFALARCRAAIGDRYGAVDALEGVPETSSAHLDASVSGVYLLVSPNGVAVQLSDVLRAAAIIDRLVLDRNQLDGLRAPVLEAAFDVVRREPDGVDGDATVFGIPLTERALRLALESTYRSLAGRAATKGERVALVDRANSIRPRSLM